MMDNENQNQPNQKISFESLDILIGKWRDGTFSEIIDDWKWIFLTANDIKERSLSTRSLVFSAHPWDWLEVWQVNI